MVSSPCVSNKDMISGSGNMEYTSNACDSDVCCCFFVEMQSGVSIFPINPFDYQHMGCPEKQIACIALRLARFEGTLNAIGQSNNIIGSE